MGFRNPLKVFVAFWGQPCVHLWLIKFIFECGPLTNEAYCTQYSCCLSATLSTQCNLDNSVKEQCGSSGVRREQCLAMDCCWQPTSDGASPWCYNAVCTYQRSGVLSYVALYRTRQETYHSNACGVVTIARCFDSLLVCM